MMKAAIFDMDGTLLDSMGMWNHALTDYLTSKGIKTISDEIKGRLATITFSDASVLISEQLVTDKTADEVYREIEAFVFEQYRTVIELKPYVRDYLIQLQQKGVHMCVATLTNRPMVEAVLKRLEVADFFDFILTVPEVGATKAEPKIYLEAVKRFGCAKDDCVVFEDSCYALTTAKNAGFYCIGVDDPWQDISEKFIHQYCDQFITGFEELLEDQ